MMFRNVYRNFHIFSRHMAGHSKWANIRHIKGAKDAERATLFQKLSRQMRAMIREQGSADPKQNLKLAHLIDQARQVNMPVEKIQQILRVDCSKEDLKSYVLEIRGPGGSFFVLEVLTSNHSKTKQSISTINKKCSGAWADGVSSHLFTYKGNIKVSPLTQDQTLEQALDHAITVGAEDVIAEDSNFCFTTSATDFYKVQRSLAELGYRTSESDLQYFPMRRVSLNEADMAAADKLYSKLMEDPDVVKVYDNIE